MHEVLFYVRGYNRRYSGSCIATTRDPRDRYLFPWNLPVGLRAILGGRCLSVSRRI